MGIFMIAACTPTEKTVTRVEGKHFGETISEKGAITYDKLLTKLDKKDKIENVKVMGKVDGVC